MYACLVDNAEILAEDAGLQVDVGILYQVCTVCWKSTYFDDPSLRWLRLPRHGHLLGVSQILRLLSLLLHSLCSNAR